LTKYILDTSVFFGDKITELINSGKLDDCELIIPLTVLDELQSQASQKKEYGINGLNEIQKISFLCNKQKIPLKFVGKRPSYDDIRLAKHGRLDALINEVALHENGILITGDYAQSLAANAHGIESILIHSDISVSTLEFEKFFKINENTMSIHLKEGLPVFAKTGVPGDFKLLKIDDQIITTEYLNKIINEIIEVIHEGVFKAIEINYEYAQVIQYGDYRITITRPPFSNKLEVTIVKPIIFLSLSDYHISDKLFERLSNTASGILISGAPGSGKSTFASALAEFYVKKGKIVKTFESPRDLHVPPEVTQYSPLHGSFENAVDLLLLVRPDYTIFDEVRRYRDFGIFADMRMAGVGMIGVIHASTHIDAIQRFIGKIELGMIPHVLDTIIFIKDGKILKILDVLLTVKVPTGMTEDDLSRPLIEIRDFETGELEYEIYTYGEENIVVPIKKINEKIIKKDDDGIRKLAISKIKDVLRRFDPYAEIEIRSNDRVLVKVEKDIVPRLIGKGGNTISELETILGIKIDVESKNLALGHELPFSMTESGSSIILSFAKEHVGSDIGLYVNDKFVLSSIIGKKSRIKIDKKSTSGKKIENAILTKSPISAYKNNI